MRCDVMTAAGRFETHLFHSRERCLAFERGMCPAAEMRDHARAQTDSFVRDDGLMVIVVWLDASLDDYDSLLMLAHEAVHVKQRILAHIGEDAPGDEDEAYVVQAAFDALMGVHGTWRKRHRKG